MPDYTYKCDTCDEFKDITHPMSECDTVHTCTEGHVMHRIPAVRETYFWGPDFAQNSHVARANVGRNPSNTNRYSKY